jgi:hypothetical protein
MVPGLGKVCLFGGKSWEEVQEPGVDDARVHSEDEMSNPRSAAWGRRRGGNKGGSLDASSRTRIRIRIIK